MYVITKMKILWHLLFVWQRRFCSVLSRLSSGECIKSSAYWYHYNQWTPRALAITLSTFYFGVPAIVIRIALVLSKLFDLFDGK